MLPTLYLANEWVIINQKIIWWIVANFGKRIQLKLDFCLINHSRNHKFDGSYVWSKAKLTNRDSVNIHSTWFTLKHMDEWMMKNYHT